MENFGFSNSTLSSNYSGNWSDPADFYPDAKPTGMVLLLIAALTVMANGVLMIAYVKSTSLHTPFNVYLINLSAGDFLQALFMGPGNFVLFFFDGWPVGRTLCSMYLYALWTLNVFVMNMHLLISLNRLWALTLPISYKQFHNKRVAAVACLINWIYAHAWALPGVIPDALYYREDSVLDCSSNYAAQPVWFLGIYLMGFDAPEAAILLLYPVITYKIWRHRRKTVIRPCVSSRAGTSSARTGLDKTGGAFIAAQPSDNGSSGTSLRRPSQSMPNLDGSLKSAPPQPLPRDLPQRRTGSSSHFKVLSLLVCGAFVCWTPLNIYYTITSFSDYSNLTYYYIANVLYYFDFMLNPVLYPLATAEWRRAVLSVLPKWRA